jgi:hypothetical protein
MAVTSLEKVKSVLRKSDSSFDEVITNLIPIVEDYMKGYCNDDFLDDEGKVSYPKGYEFIAIRIIQYVLNNKAGLNSEGIDVYNSVFSTDFPADVLRGLKRRLNFK